MNRFKARLFAMSSALAVGLALPALAQDLPVIRIQAVAGSIGAAPLMILEERGLDEKYGFDAQIDYLGMSGGFQSFLVGNYDITNDEDAVGIAAARAEGFDVHGFYPNGFLYMGIVIPGDSEATDPTDLIGERVGHFGLDSGTTTYTRIIVEQLFDFDLTSEYQLQQVGPAALVPLLESGEVEAILNFEPHVSAAMVATDGRYLIQAGSAYREANNGFAPPMGIWAAKSEWLQANPALAYAFRDAISEAYAIIDETEYEIFREPFIADELGIASAEVLDQMIVNGHEYGYFTGEWTAETVATGQAFLERLAADGVVLDSAPAQTMVTLEEIIGPRP